MLTDQQHVEIAVQRSHEELTRRVSVPALEEMLYLPIPVLDHGFVRVIDYMGDDSAVVQAARVSYGRGTHKVSEDAGLIRYLMRHWHTTPFEMCAIKYHVRLPIFVARQWIRHRTACLAGDVKVTFDLPGGIDRRGCQAYTLTVKQIFDRFRPTSNISDRVQGMLLRSCDEDDMTPYHTAVAGIWECGIKPILRVDFGEGRVLRATNDHLCLTDAGWLRLEDAIEVGAKFAAPGKRCGYTSFTPKLTETDLASEQWRPVLSNPKYEVSSLGRVRSLLNIRGVPHVTPVLKEQTITPAGYQVVSLSSGGISRSRFVHHLVLEAFIDEPRMGRETLHLDNNRSNNHFTNIKWDSQEQNAEQRMNGGCDQRLSVIFLPPLSCVEDEEEMTYDIEVAGPYHNFCAGGVYVHNSVNEYSARYSILDKEFYIPAPEHLAAQSTTNRQGRGEVLAGDEAAEVLDILRTDAARCHDHYLGMLNEDAEGNRSDPARQGLARELARMNLTLNTYTQWYWKTDLHNLLHFLSLRADPHAQYEIRVYAEAMMRTVEAWVPATYAAFRDYRLGAVTFSAGMMALLRRLLAGEVMRQEDSGLTKREWTEMMQMLWPEG